MKHLTDGQLIDRIYGMEGDAGHLSECEDCAARLRTFERRRQELIPSVPVSSEFLMAQRRGVYARVSQAPATRLKWVPAALAACLLAAVTLAYRPAQAPAPAAHTESADAQLFSEVYSMEQTAEPRAASPIHELFEDNQ